MLVNSIYLIGFRGLGIRDPKHQDEHGLILLGHVGICFEGSKNPILGFHPTPETISKIGNYQQVLERLKNRDTLEGCLQDDTIIFKRAYELSHNNPRITVWQYTIQLENTEFQSIRELTLRWYQEKKSFLYGLPAKGGTQTWDNCATFPRRLGLPLPEETGQLYWYIAALASQQNPWNGEDIYHE